ncbi:hypothetical protein AV530_003111 [Patagioenas fasciata monilis]|uniref:Uncharacterized protein n=1 Tax=Patagioenas fasciata monilis TaxID=372326 RepID=A0A1V4KWC7_PATFA|nr:hypothetical protein AV530_003111 [Patagioenas fasciata monilis]
MERKERHRTRKRWLSAQGGWRRRRKAVGREDGAGSSTRVPERSRAAVPGLPSVAAVLSPRGMPKRRG